VRVEVTLTGVCHCPRQIISSTARYTHSAASANLPQDERGPQWKSRVHAPMRASARYSRRLHVLCTRIDTHPPSHPEGWSSVVHFPVQRTHPARALLAVFLALLRDCPPIFATLVILAHLAATEATIYRRPLATP